ncbi:chromatin assembly factor 1 subunit A-B isoform X1 [Bactrocera neohumeralis]|uniref:chromatin assembly factor 1 subunit A-B isoform X1 n=1 Tax=Bactrocera neohumeralis TaxID=98809 RepID=UPI0021651066|nr:chromatin assembly factor 1 subunit A-B isoform X1 [Bactrocera neohumeralis]
MQNPAVKTPATSKREGAAARKSSGKKLVQARLPFKIIPTGTPTAAASSISAKDTDETAKDGRKRKLSFEADKSEKAEGAATDELRGRSASKENLTVRTKKLKTDEQDDVILLDDDDILEDEDGNVKDAERTEDENNASSNEKVEKQVKKTPVATKTQKAIKQAKNKVSNAVSSPRTPKPSVATEKDANTPKSAKAKNSNTPGSAKNKSANSKGGGSATKVQIKLPLGSAKTNKRRKSMITADSKDGEVVISSDENEDIPVKRQKVGGSPNEQKKVDDTDKVSSTMIKDCSITESEENSNVLVLELGGNATDLPDSELDSRSSSETLKSINTTSEHSSKILKSTAIVNKNNDSPKLKTVSASSKETVKKQCKPVSPTKADDVKPISSESESISTENKPIEITESQTDDNETHGKSSSEPQITERNNSPQAEKMKVGNDKKAKKTPQQKPKTPTRATKANKDKKSVDTPTTSEKTPQQKPKTPTRATKANKDKKSVDTPTTSEKGNVSTNKKSPIKEDKIENNEKVAEVSLIINSTSDSESATSNNDESKSFAEESTPRVAATPKIARDDALASKKNLTPKQMQLMEQRRKAREEKERRLQEEKLQKQREKEAKELSKKREREEREEQRRKEREEKDEQKRKEREERDELKRKEREEKERKRLAEQEVKNEEKRKRNEAKEEELRKKEEERKRKEGADLKAKKEAEAFQKFFKAKRAVNADGEAGQQQAQQNDSKDPEILAFRPFEIKGDMKLAPIRRKLLSAPSRKQLDTFMADVPAESTHLYLDELKSGKIVPGIWRRISVDTKVSEDEVQVIDDELDRAGQAIVEETHAPIEHFRAKFYKFHENRRPPYYGTWRKRTNVIKPRRPFVQDAKFFDYEVDSDLEWEEEEPGESLDGSDDEKEKESEDDDYEVDNEWFVPHGHLSEEELQNEDDVLDANTREAQKAKLQVLQQEFAQEMKKKTEKIKPRLIGCIWADENGNQPALCPKIIWDTLNLRAMLFEAPPLLEDPEVAEKSELGSPTNNEKTVEKVKPIKITERMLNDLVRLVHGNQHSKNFLIKEFIAYLEASEESIKNGEVRGPIKSIVREKIDDFAEWTIIESTKVLQKNKKKNKKRLCWVVSADVLKKMGLEDLGLHNTWKYTLQPKSSKDETTKAEVEVPTENETKETTEIACDTENPSETESKATDKKQTKKEKAKEKKLKTKSEITKFTKVLPPKTGDPKSPKAAVTPATKEDANASSVECNESPTTVVTSPASTKPTANVKKRVPLLMSVARGQNIPQPAKNALISEFLKKSTAEKAASASETTNAAATSTAKEDSKVVELD